MKRIFTAWRISHSRSRLFLLPLLLLVAMFTGGNLLHAAETNPSFAKATAGRPNILIMLADDLGWADVGFNGSKEIPTPHLDSLARNGVRCSAGYVTAPQCSPTRAGLLTGRYQQRFGHDNNNYNLACFHTGQRLFPEHLKAAGYVRRHPNRPWFLYTAFNAPRCSQNGMR